MADEKLPEIVIVEPRHAPICLGCAHLHRPGDLPQYTCDAFPRGIPVEILKNQFNHTRPHPRDGGIRFEPVPYLEDVIADDRRDVETSEEP